MDETETPNTENGGKEDYHAHIISSEMIPILSAEEPRTGNDQGSQRMHEVESSIGKQGSMPRFLEIEISPLLLSGIFSLSSTAKARKEMERGYLKLLGNGAADEAPQVSLSLPILHVDSSGGKRKKIIGWDKAQTKPLRVLVDSEGKAKPVIEYGIVGQDNKDTTPLGTVEIPVRFNHLGPRQLHLNLKNIPLWPINAVSRKTNNSSEKFRLSANSRLSLQLSIKAGTETAATPLENRVAYDECDEHETKPSAKRTLQSIAFASLFRCFCANNDKEAAKLAADSNLKPIKLSMPTAGMTIDAEDNSLLDDVPHKEPIVAVVSDESKIIKVRQHSRAVKLPMSFSSTTGSVSDTDADHFRDFFCYPLMINDDSSDGDSMGDDDSAHVKEAPKKVSRDQSVYKSTQLGLIEPLAVENRKPQKTRGLLAALKQSVSAFKIRCASPRCTQSIGSSIAEGEKALTMNDCGQDFLDKNELVEIVSDETNSVSTAPSGTGCMPFSDH